MISHFLANFGDHRHCGSGNIVPLVAEEENSRCSCFNPPLLFISKRHSDPGHTRSKQQYDKNLKTIFPSPSKNVVEKEKENNGTCKAFCVTHKRKQISCIRE